MKVVFACGGTAGHINPAIAIAQILKKKHCNIEVIFFGRPNSLESDLIAKEGYRFISLEIESFKSRLTVKNLLCAKKMLEAYKLAKSMLQEIHPDAVIGTGGYVCFPVLRAAISLKIPTAIHESNAIAGKSVKILSKKCNQIWLGFESAKKEIKHKNKIIVTGNPIRENFRAEDKYTARLRLGLKNNDFFILSFGGSGGALHINQTILELWEMDLPSHWHFCHICGKKYENMFKEWKCNKTKKWFSYATNMPSLMQATDLVICRSGAMTISEISYLQKPAILIPSPNVKANHQYYNAKALADADAAILISETNLTPNRLFEEIKKVSKDEILRRTLSAKLINFSPQNAEDVILKAFNTLIALQ